MVSIEKWNIVFLYVGDFCYAFQMNLSKHDSIKFEILGINLRFCSCCSPMFLNGGNMPCYRNGYTFTRQTVRCRTSPESNLWKHNSVQVALLTWLQYNVAEAYEHKLAYTIKYEQYYKTRHSQSNTFIFKTMNKRKRENTKHGT